MFAFVESNDIHDIALNRDPGVDRWWDIHARIRIY